MQKPTTMDKVVIEDYYHIITMDENVKWMNLIHLLSKKFYKSYVLYIYLYFKVINSLFKCID